MSEHEKPFMAGALTHPPLLKDPHKELAKSQLATEIAAVHLVAPFRIHMSSNSRERAMFNLAIDSKLRAPAVGLLTCDALRTWVNEGCP